MYIMRELSLKWKGIIMKFSRKLVVREGTYGTLSVPKCVLDAWQSVETVEMQFDESSNILVVRPIAGVKV